MIGAADLVRAGRLLVDVEVFVDHLRQHAVGRRRALTARAIRARLGYADRYLRLLAHEATARGLLICADNAGYFVPASEAEVREAVGRLRSQASEMLARAEALERLARERFVAVQPSLLAG